MEELNEKQLSEWSSGESSSESSSRFELPVISKWEKLEEELTCFSCDKLFSDPTTIPCLHTFCTKCLQEGIDKETKAFYCFVCKAKFKETKINSSRVNTSLKYLVGIVKKRNSLFMKATIDPGDMQSVVTVLCSQCVEGAPATMWCLTCEDGETCDECYKSHCRMKIFQLHKIILLKDFIESPDPVLNYCPFQEHCRYHRNRPAKFYCQSCLKFACQECQCVSNDSIWHECDAIDKVYETEKIDLEELQASLQSVVPNFETALRNNKAADHELEECITKEVAWVKEQFQGIREAVDKYEEDLLQNLDTIKNTGKKYLEAQKIDIIQLQDQLTSCAKFILGVLQPCRSGEMLAYYKWIKELAMKIIESRDLDPAYNVNDLLIAHGDISANNFVDKLSSLNIHQAFHQPHLPNCTANLTCACIVPVVVKVVMKDKYNLPVPNQLPLLEICPKNSDRKFFIDFMKWCGEKGVYYFSYFPKVKEPHKISVTWKSEPLNEQDIEVTGTLDYSIMSKRFHYLERYNKRNLKKPQFLSVTPNGFETIVSDPADNRLIFFVGPYIRYQYVITNDNNAFHPCGSAVGCNGYLYVADAFYNCILKFKYHSFSKCYGNSYFARFGEKGSKNGQFDCPQGLVISKSNYIFICDKNNHRIQVYSITKNCKDEEFSFSIGNFGQEPGCFNHPTDLTLNRVEDKLFVADTDNHRVQVFTSSGQFMITFPHHYQNSVTSAYMFRNMEFPVGICYGMDGHILVSCKHKVLVFEEDGTQVTTIALYHKNPTGIIARDTGHIAIALTQCGQIAYSATY